MSKNTESSTNLKILLVFISVITILGLWMVFASRAQRETMVIQVQPQPVISGEIYFPEMPTLVPIVDINQQMANSQPEQPAQTLRNISMPTSVATESAPQVGIQSIIVSGSSNEGSSSNSGSNNSSSSSQPAPQTSTGTS